MTITDIRIFPVGEEKLKAFASIILDRCFVVTGIKIIEGGNGLFLSMPSKKRRDGTYKDIAHPLNAETRAMMETAILGKYRETLAASAPAEAETGATDSGAEPAEAEAAPSEPASESPAAPVETAAEPESQPLEAPPETTA